MDHASMMATRLANLRRGGLPTPHINEALFRATYESRELRSEPVPGVFLHLGDLALLRVQVRPELINMYAESLPDAASTITLEFTFEFTLVTTVGSTTFNNPTTNPWLKATKTWPLATGAMGANSYEVLGWQDVFEAPDYRRSLGASANEQPRITDFKVAEARLTLTNDASDAVLDFAELPSQASGYSWTWGPLEVEKPIEFSAEVDDPSDNASPDGWHWSDYQELF